MMAIMSFEDFQAQMVKASGPNGADMQTLFERVTTLLHDGGVFTKKEEGFTGAKWLVSNEALSTFCVNGQNARASLEAFVSELRDSQNEPMIPAHRQKQCVLDLARVLSGSVNSLEHFNQKQRAVVTGDDVVPVSLQSVCGRAGLEMLGADAIKYSLEAFGVNIDNLSTDNRVNIVLALLRSSKYLIDRMIPRSVEAQNAVIIDVPVAEVYRLDMASNDLASIRNGDHRKLLIDLQRDPTSVDTSLIPIVVLKSQDPTGARVLDDGILKVGARANLFDLSRVANRIGYNVTDYTDLVSEGGNIKSLRVEVSKTVNGTTTTELFKINTSFHRLSPYVQKLNVNDSGDRQADLELLYGLDSTSKTSTNVDTALLAAFVDVTVALQISLTGKLSIKTGDVASNGRVDAELRAKDQDLITNTLKAALAELTFEVVGYEPDVKYSEENVRKSNIAIRLNRRQRAFEIPGGRNYQVQWSIMQAGPDVNSQTDVLMSQVYDVISLGNTSRALTIINSKIDDTYDQLQHEKTHPELVGMYDSVKANSIAGTLVYPNVLKFDIDLDEANVATMDESNKLSNIHAYVMQQLLAALAVIYQTTLYTARLGEGEKPVFKLLTSPAIKSILIGISNYHNVLNTQEAAIKEGTANSDYSLYTPDGTRLDVYTTFIRDYADNMILFPIRPNNDPNDVTNFARTLDRGLFTASYSPTQNNSVERRTMVSAREWALVTNCVAMKVKVINLDKQLKSMGDDTFELAS